MTRPALKIEVPVELFGVPRLRAGCGRLVLSLPPQVTAARVVQQMVEACPALRETVLRDDLQGLKDGYVFNLNGLAFLRDDTFSLQSGDTLLLLSNQAGGKKMYGYHGKAPFPT